MPVRGRWSSKSNLGNLTRQPGGSAWKSAHPASNTETIPLDPWLSVPLRSATACYSANRRRRASAARYGQPRIQTVSCRQPCGGTWMRLLEVMAHPRTAPNAATRRPPAGRAMGRSVTCPPAAIRRKLHAAGQHNVGWSNRIRVQRLHVRTSGCSGVYTTARIADETFH